MNIVFEQVLMLLAGIISAIVSAVLLQIVLNSILCGIGFHMVTYNGCVIDHYCIEGWL
jgi:hypothetical protein